MSVALKIGLCLIVLWLLAELVFLFAISHAIRKAQAVPDFQNMTVKDAAEGMLKANNLSTVKVLDSIEPGTTVSDPHSVYISKTGQKSHSVSVLAVSLHEVGHAISYYKESALYMLSLYLTKFSRFALLAAIPGCLVGLAGHIKLLTELCVWIYAASGLLIIIMHAADREASRYAEQYLNTTDFLDVEQKKACFHLMRVNDWSFIQFIFEPFFLIVIFISSLIGRFVRRGSSS